MNTLRALYAGLFLLSSSYTPHTKPDGIATTALLLFGSGIIIGAYGGAKLGVFAGSISGQVQGYNKGKEHGYQEGYNYGVKIGYQQGKQYVVQRPCNNLHLSENQKTALVGSVAVGATALAVLTVLTCHSAGTGQ